MNSGSPSYSGSWVHRGFQEKPTPAVAASILLCRRHYSWDPRRYVRIPADRERIASGRTDSTASSRRRRPHRFLDAFGKFTERHDAPVGGGSASIISWGASPPPAERLAPGIISVEFAFGPTKVCQKRHFFPLARETFADSGQPYSEALRHNSCEGPRIGMTRRVVHSGKPQSGGLRVRSFAQSTPATASPLRPPPHAPSAGMRHGVELN